MIWCWGSATSNRHGSLSSADATWCWWGFTQCQLVGDFKSLAQCENYFSSEFLKAKNNREWILPATSSRTTYHGLHIEDVTIVRVIVAIFGNVCKVWKIFSVLTGAIDIFNAVLTNHSLTFNVDELNSVVRYREANWSLDRMHEWRMVWRTRRYHAISFLELLDRFTSRFCSAKLFNHGRSEVLQWKKRWRKVSIGD